MMLTETFLEDNKDDMLAFFTEHAYLIDAELIKCRSTDLGERCHFYCAFFVEDDELKEYVDTNRYVMQNYMYPALLTFVREFEGRPNIRYAVIECQRGDQFGGRQIIINTPIPMRITMMRDLTERTRFTLEMFAQCFEEGN